MKLTIPRRSDIQAALQQEEGQTMAEYSVVVTLIIITVGMVGFVVLATAIIGELDRITAILS
jgi:Flp pilus assembly pilin Flp